MLKYKCEKCGATLESPSSLAGQKDQCPFCKHAYTVPERKTGATVLVVSYVGGGLLLVVALALFIVHGAKGPGSATVGTTETRPATQVASSPRGMNAPVVVVSAGTQPATRAVVQAAKPPQEAPLSPEQLFEKASPAVVYIVVRDKEFKPIGLGSGFFVDAAGLIVTNYHVIKGAEFATARLSKGATLFVDGVVATDPDADLALLKVSGAAPAFLKTADGPLPKVGAAVYAIGNPRGLENTFSGGMVSGHRELKEGLTAIQVTTPISPGSSGGPLLNAAGEVVGVTTAYLAGGQNLNFAVPVAAVQRLMQRQGKVQTLASAGGGRLEKAETEELDKAWAAMAKKDWQGASEILIRLRKSQRDNPLVWFALGYLHRRLGNDEIAIQHYKQVITLKPDYAEAYFWMGISYSVLNLYTEAIAAHQQAIAVKPDYAEAYNHMGHDYWLQGVETLKKAKTRSEAIAFYEQALAAYRQALAIKPDYADAYLGMGDTYNTLLKFSESLAAYKQVIAIKPDYAHGLTEFGPEYGRAYYGMGNAYKELEKYTEAGQAYFQAMMRGEKAAWYGLGSVSEKQGNRALALDAYQKYLEYEPTGWFAKFAQDGIRRLEGK